MQRRSFLTLLGGAAAAWPLAARSQQTAMPVIGFIGVESPALYTGRVRAFLQGLSEAGFIEGRNVAIEYRWAEGHNDRLAALVADLVRRHVAVIAAPASTESALVAKAATKTIPVVFSVSTDPVAIGLVASLNRPGGNLTGNTNLTVEVAAKRIELLHELRPTAASLALLINPTNPVNAESQIKESEFAAHSLGVHLLVFNASNEAEIESAFAAVAQQLAGGIVISGDPFFAAHHQQIIEQATRHRMPTIEQFREFAEAGGLMSYGAPVLDVYRLSGEYTGRILRGEKPADLPMQQASKIELVINMKTAKTLGINFPTALLVRADEVIE